MEVVEREARGGARAPAARRSLGDRLRHVPDLGGMRPAVAWVSAAFLLAVGIAGGFGVAHVTGGGNDTRTVQASVDARPGAGGEREPARSRHGQDGALLRVHGMPSLAARTRLPGWVQRGREIVPQSTFDVGRDGGAATAVVEDLRDADAVMVTREPRGGSMRAERTAACVER